MPAHGDKVRAGAVTCLARVALTVHGTLDILFLLFQYGCPSVIVRIGFYLNKKVKQYLNQSVALITS
jgi:hypothetical protein